MRVLFFNRFDWSTNMGGDSIQMLKTKEFLQKLGIQVDIAKGYNYELSNYDLVHVFNLMRPNEAISAIKLAKRYNKKIVFSSIFWDFTEFNKLGRENKNFFRLLQLLPLSIQEKLKDIIRLKGDDIKFRNWFLNFFTYYKKILLEVDLFLPNSKSEGEIVCDFLGKKVSYHVVYNGIDTRIFKLGNVQRKNIGIYSARLDPRKNHVNLFKAYTKSDIHLYGNKSAQHQKYYQRLTELNPGNYQFKGQVGYDYLADCYNSSNFHVMPSWLETPGLSQLEAAACGCKIISTNRGSAKDYFGNYASYCDPNDLSDIKNKIVNALDTKINRNELSEYIVENFSWAVSAEQTKFAYEKVLDQ